MVMGRRTFEYQYHLHYGKSTLACRHLDESIGHLSSAVRLNSDAGEAYFYLARAFRLRGDTGSMAENLRRSRDLGFSERRIRAEECFALAQSGQFLPIQRQIQALFLDPGEDGRELCESVSVGYLQTFQVSQALAVIEAWKRDYPDDSRPWLVSGVYYAEGALWAKALEAFERGLEVDPNATDILFQLGRTQLELNKLTEASTTFQRCLARNANDVEALAALATVRFKSGQVVDSAALAKKALQINQRHFASLCLLGQVQLAENRPDEALTVLKEACNIKPFDPTARYHYAMALRRSGDTVAADEILRASEDQHKAQSQLRGMFAQLAADPQNAQIRIAIGEILLEHGDPSEGIAILQSALLFDPGNVDAQSLISSAAQSVTKSSLNHDGADSKRPANTP